MGTRNPRILSARSALLEQEQESEPHHIGTTPYRNHITTANNLGILQRSPAFFSDRDLEWVGDGLEDLGGLGEERFGSYGVLDWQWNLDNWTTEPVTQACETERRCRARTGPGIEQNPRNLHGQDSEPATMAFIHLIHGQGHSAFISSAEKDPEKRACCAAKISAFSHFQHHSIHGQGLFSIHSFDSTGESSGDPHSRMSLLLRNLSHEGMACLEGGVVSWFQATTTPWFPIRPSAAWHCHDFHTHVDIPSS